MPENCSTKKVRISLVGKEGKMGQMVCSLAEKDPCVEVSDDGDVVIDFSSPEGTKKAIAMGKPLVCGTTGLSEEIIQQLHTLSEKVPVLYSPNFSLGMDLCFQMMEFLNKKLGSAAKIAIEETHHTQKVDSPSGTAKRMAELLGVENVTVRRENDVVGIHQVDFLLSSEKISLRHVALSRAAFAEGAISAAKFLYNKPPKFYSLRDIFVCK